MGFSFPMLSVQSELIICILGKIPRKKYVFFYGELVNFFLFFCTTYVYGRIIILILVYFLYFSLIQKR